MTEPSKVLPPTYFGAAIALLLVLHFLLASWTWLAEPWTYAAVVPALLGLVFVLQPARVFDMRQTTIKPFQESTTLVTDGLYDVSRNPMYLGMVLLLLALAVFLGDLWALGVPVAFQWVLTRRFILAEEAALLQKFGAEYEEYRRSVRRWI